MSGVRVVDRLLLLRSVLGQHARPPAWPGTDAVELADGSLVVSATVPRPGVVVVRAIGEIDILTAPAWRRSLGAAALIAASPASPGPASGAAPVGVAGRHTPRLVCDLSAPTFLGATGLGVLVDIAAQTTSAGVDLRVVAGSRSVRRLLGLTRLDHHIATALLRAGLAHHVRTGTGQDGGAPDPATAVLAACAHLAAGGREDAYLALRTARDFLPRAPAPAAGAAMDDVLAVLRRPARRGDAARRPGR